MSERRCATPGCDRAPRTSGQDGKTLHAHCDDCERKMLAEWLKPKR